MKVRSQLAVLCVLTCAVSGIGAQPGATLRGVLSDVNGRPVQAAELKLTSITNQKILEPLTRSSIQISAQTDEQGAFSFAEVLPGDYKIEISWHGITAIFAGEQYIQPGDHLNLHLRLAIHQNSGTVTIIPTPAAESNSRGQDLSKQQVSELPLNKRDFSQLLLLAAGTMTDTNGSASFTAQFAVNGLRGAYAVFAMDGIDMTDPEVGGATFTNFNVDAVQEIQSVSGVMPAEFGHGAAGFTNIKTKSGTAHLHGTAFEFVRNSAFDARNFFDRQNFAQPGRIPHFSRNEFGFTLGGPLYLPGIYSSHGRTFFFGQYQGFRQVLGTTQILSVPTQAERQGIDSTAFPGDTLTVPVNPEVAPVLAAYPQPNDPQGPFGARTYATSARVVTNADQFSIRVDHHVSDVAQLFVRFNLDNVNGPITNPNQAAINPTFITQFHQPQRNAGLNYTRNVSPHFTSETSFGYIRSMPLFLPANSTQPGMNFADNLYEAFNGPAGSLSGFIGNLFQFRQNFAYLHGKHAFKFGAELRFNRDGSIFAQNPDGQYTFGGGNAYAPEAITSASGEHNIPAGAPLPDTLSAFLSASAFSYNTTAALFLTPKGDRFDEVAVRREAYNFFFQDAWKVTPKFTLNYGLRYEVNSRQHEAELRTATFLTVDSSNKTVPVWQVGARQIMVLNPQPPYNLDLRGWGPRVSTEWRVASGTVLNAGGGITTIVPPQGAEYVLAGVFPFIVSPIITALPNAPVPFSDAVVSVDLPTVYTSTGQLAFPRGRTTDVAPNTLLDVPRFQRDLAAITPGNQAQPLAVFGTSPYLPNGYIENFTAGVEQTIKDFVVNASYVGTAGVKLPSVISPNGYSGASPEYAPFTQFDSNGHVTGGYGPETLMGTPSHSTYHALQVSVAKNSARLGLGVQGSYTYGKALDDSSAIVFNFGSSAGTVLQTLPQDPHNPGRDKGPATFDTTHAFSASVIQILPLSRISFLHPFGKRALDGWQILNITTLTSGSPFSVYSGIQQTGVGSAGADRPDQVGIPRFSTHRTVREDYFGRATENKTFFSIPIGIPGGTGPNQGRFGTLGRNTFRGPGYCNFDFALIKDTPIATRSKSDRATLEFRAEFFNAFNLVNFGLPVNIVQASGFGLINRTSGTSRQIQLSLKLLF